MKLRRARQAIILMLVFVLALIVVAGCAPAAAPRAAIEAEKVMELAAPEAAALVERGVAEAMPQEVPADALAERMIIRTGNLSLIVKDTAEAMDQITALVKALNGYVAESNAYRSGELLRGNMTVRVPAQHFDAAFDQLKEIAVRVQQQNTSGQDVTEEYTDLSARLRNLEATEKELLELLATVRERTGKAEDILAVHRELTEIRSQIEQLKGRMQYLERMTALATIRIELVPDQLGKPIIEPTWQPGVTLRSALSALASAGQFLVDLIIWVVIFLLPIFIVIAIPIVILVVIIRSTGKRKKAA